MDCDGASSPILWTAPGSQEVLAGLGLLVMWVLKLGAEVSLNRTRSLYKAKEGGTDCTRNSCCLAKVESNRRDNQSSPDSSGTLLPLIIA